MGVEVFFLEQTKAQLATCGLGGVFAIGLILCRVKNRSFVGDSQRKVCKLALEFADFAVSEQLLTFDSEAEVLIGR